MVGRAGLVHYGGWGVGGNRQALADLWTSGADLGCVLEAPTRAQTPVEGRIIPALLLWPRNAPGLTDHAGSRPRGCPRRRYLLFSVSVLSPALVGPHERSSTRLHSTARLPALKLPTAHCSTALVAAAAQHSPGPLHVC